MARQKFEREIEEIFDKMEHARPGEPVTHRAQRSIDRVRRRVALPAISLNPATLMIGSLALAILSFPLRYVAPHLIGTVSTISLVSFVVGLLLAFANRNRKTRPKWRGHEITYHTYSASGPNLLERIWRRLRRWQKTRHWNDRR